MAMFDVVHPDVAGLYSDLSNVARNGYRIQGFVAAFGPVRPCLVWARHQQPHSRPLEAGPLRDISLASFWSNSYAIRVGPRQTRDRLLLEILGL